MDNLITFDYAGLDAETRIVVQQRTGEIRTLVRRTAQDIIDIGEKLADVKQRLGHGSFGAWLDVEFAWSESAALKMMQVAEAFKNVNFTEMQFGASALYMLAAPSTPESARSEAIQRAEAGEQITHKAAKQIVATHRPPVTPRGPAGNGTYEDRIHRTKPVDDYVDDVPEIDLDSNENPYEQPADYEQLWRFNPPLHRPTEDDDDHLSDDERPALPPDDAEAKRQAARLKRDAKQAAKVAVPAELSGPSWQLHHGDFVQVCEALPNASIDVVVTDPPYGREHLHLYRQLAQVSARLLTPGGSLLVMCGQYMLPDVLREMTPFLNYHWMLSYLTLGGQSAQIFPRKVNPFWKPVLWFVNGAYDGDWQGDVIKSGGNEKSLHEWQQSESGMADIVHRFSYPDQLILDPFLGSGTTGIVAVRQHRRFVGIDCDAAAVATAHERLTALEVQIA